MADKRSPLVTTTPLTSTQSSPSRPTASAPSPAPTPPPYHIRGRGPLLGVRNVTATSTSTKLCTMINTDLASGNPDAKCLCNSSIILTPMRIDMPTIYTQSCDYTAIPTQDPDTGNRTVPTITDGLFDGPSLGSTYSSSPSPPGSATITMGESSVHVGQLTSTMLYNSIFSVLDDACPPVASATECVQDKYPITGIMFRDINHQLNYGTLEVQVQSSNYTDDATQRDAMIKAIASNLQASTLPANNCKIEQMDTGMMPPTAPKRWLPSFLQPRYSPGEETATLCSSVEYANVEYWKPGSTQRASDAWLTVHIDFEKPPVTPIWCGFLEDAFDIMGDAFPDLKAGSEVADDAIDILCSSGGDGKKGSHKHVRMKNGMKFSIGE